MAVEQIGIYDVPGYHQICQYFPPIALGTTDEVPIFKAPCKCTIVGLSIVPSAAVTGNDDANFSLQVFNRGTAGAGTEYLTTLEQFNTGDNLVAHDEFALTLNVVSTSSPLVLETGEILTLRKIEEGAGLALPEGIIKIEFMPGSLIES